MKKIVSFVLALTMLMMAGAALAETIKPAEFARSFDVEITLPEGATTAANEVGENTMTAITLAEAGKPGYVFIISPSDMQALDGKKMSELTDEEKASLVEAMSLGMDSPSERWVTLDNGGLLLLVEENTEANDYAYATTLYDGFFIFVYASYEDYDKMTEEDIQVMIDIMQSLKIIPVEQ